ncbi:glycosyltransferase family 2 protein [Hahella ganghwensis]|uniref:glycosyltransferase family 2 protein n=1 Tax=Hahella ganghwensis TaxID=286420 RepID=UPI00035DAC23|nr:glycosyltransferase [Hahella ganghwensis]
MTQKISVVMPVYNGENFLNDAIESILNQTFTEFEFIIVNDGSIDRSLEIIESYSKNDNRIVVISRYENMGLLYSLNEALDRAKGEFIARMDADDISLPTRLEKQLLYLEQNELDICGCHYYLINDRGDYIDAALVPVVGESFPVYLSYTTPFAHGAVMFRSSLLAEEIKYGCRGYKSAEDYALWSELYARNYAFGNVNEFLFLYRDISSSLSKVNSKSVKKDAIRISKKNLQKYEKDIYFRIRSLERRCFSKREEEIISICLLRLAFYIGKFSALLKLRSISKRAVVIGTMRFLIESIR